MEDKCCGNTASSHCDDLEAAHATGKTRPALCQNWPMFATLNHDVATLKNDGLQLLPPATTPVAPAEDLLTSARFVNWKGGKKGPKRRLVRKGKRKDPEGEGHQPKRCKKQGQG